MNVIITEKHVHDLVFGYRLIHAKFFQLLHGGKIVNGAVPFSVIALFNWKNLSQLPRGVLADKMIGVFDGSIKVVQSLSIGDMA